MLLEYFIVCILLKAKRPERKRKMNVFPKVIEDMIKDYKNQLEQTEKMEIVIGEMKEMHNINTGLCNNCLEYKYSLNWGNFNNANFCGHCIDNMGMEMDDFDDFGLEDEEIHPYAQFTQ